MTLKQLNILLADDDPDDTRFFKEAVGELELSTRLVTVSNGEHLMHLLTDETNALPDVLFLDLNMPRKNGFECLSEIKFNKKLKGLPVIALCTSFEQEVVNQLYTNGANYFIRKPSEFLQYKKIILQALTLIQQESVSQPARQNFVITLENTLKV